MIPKIVPSWAAIRARIPRDKLLHLALGVAAVAAALLVSAIARYDLGFACAVGSTLLGLGYEWQQKFRGEDTFSLLDAAATAAPGFVVWGALALFGVR